MAKSKNHTANNNSYKNHRNGIKKPKKYRFTTNRGKCPKFLKNRYYAIKGLSGKRHAAALARNARIKKTAAKRKEKKRAIRKEAKKAKRTSDSQLKEVQRIEKEKAARAVEVAFKKRLGELRKEAKRWNRIQKRLPHAERRNPKNIYAELGFGKKKAPKQLTATQKRDARLARRKKRRAAKAWVDKLALLKKATEGFTKEERNAYRKNKLFEAECAQRRFDASVQKKMREARVANLKKKKEERLASIEAGKVKKARHADIKRKRVARHVGALKKLGKSDPHAEAHKKLLAY